MHRPRVTGVWLHSSIADFASIKVAQGHDKVMSLQCRDAQARSWRLTWHGNSRRP